MLHIITYPSPISTYPVHSQDFHNNISKANYRYILTRKESEVLGVFTYYHSTLINKLLKRHVQMKIKIKFQAIITEVIA